MRLLLDTHIFIWMDSHQAKLSPTAKAALGDPANTLFLSTASLWEMQIKINLGRLPLRQALCDIVKEQQQINRIRLARACGPYFCTGRVPHYQKDPFDRLLLAQAIAEGMTVVSADRVFPRYPIKLIQ